MEPKERLRAQIKVLTERVDRHVELPNYGFGNPALSDFKIRAKDKTFYVSKYQLAVKSRVFAKMFEVDMNEKKEGVMKLDDDPDVVEAMLKYMYMYKKVEGIELARKVVQLAHRYEIDELKDQCELDMIRGLKKKDAEDILMFSWELKLSTLYLHCIDVLHNNFNGFDHDITFDGNSIYLDRCSPVVATNHSNVEIAFKVYTSDLESRMDDFRTIGPSEKLTLSADTFNDTFDKMAVVYYAPYVPDFFDYDDLHLLSSARFFTVRCRGG